MAVTSGLLILLSLTSVSLGAPVAADDGQYHPPTKYDDGKYHPNSYAGWKPAAPSEVPVPVIASISKAAPVSVTVPVSKATPVLTTSSTAKATSVSTTASVSKAAPASKVSPVSKAPEVSAVGSIKEVIKAPVLNAEDSGDNGTTASGPVSYRHFVGDGTSTQGWPSSSQWIDFEQMFANNKPVMAASCAPASENNSEDEIADIKKAILAQAAATGVDSRFILATIMEESTGCVRVKTTTSPGGISNPGLMQDHAGTASCFGQPAPCSSDTISKMIAEGTGGTGSGDGLKQTLAQAKSSGATDGAATYIAARLYNSGSYTGGPLEKGAATACYASDVANLLMGFAAALSPCKLGTV